VRIHSVCVAAFLASAGAAAADGLPSSPRLPASWTGLYAGVNAGAAWSDVKITDTNGGVDPGPFSASTEAAFGGGQAGYNLQLGMVVVGVEGDLGYMGQLGKGTIPSSTPTFHQDTTIAAGLYGDITGRAGVVVGARTLIYGKGGFAFLDAEGKQVTTKPGYQPTGTGNLTGWVYGGGVEHALGRGWTAKVEYLHFDFRDGNGLQTSTGDPPIGFQYFNHWNASADTLKAGLNYRF
jgi:outer membrane immunogenic protein